MTVLEVADFVLKLIREHSAIDPSRLSIIYLFCPEARPEFDRFIIVMLLIKYLFCSIDHYLNVAQIIDLLFLVSDTIIAHSVAYIADLLVHIITRHEDILKPLVANLIIVDTSNRQIVPEIFPVKTIELTSLTRFVYLQKAN